MPEGPSIIILREQLDAFVGREVLRVSGNSKINQQRLAGQTVAAFRSWGKHFLVEFPAFSLRVHFMLFGSYKINESDQRIPRLSLKFKNGEINLYACSVKYIEGSLDEAYDWTADVMSDQWDAKAARRKLKEQPELLACDALLDQSIFAGVGNIIKNEALFRVLIHPESQVGALPARKLTELVAAARDYAFDFLEWKKAFVLKAHWLVHTKKICPRCDSRLHYEAHLGKTGRRSFFCDNCQTIYRLKDLLSCTKKIKAKKSTRAVKLPL